MIKEILEEELKVFSTSKSYSRAKFLLSKFSGMKFHLKNQVAAESLKFERIFTLID